jgi:hypothetical protein
MKRYSIGRTNLTFVALCITALVLWLAMIDHQKRARTPPIKMGNNPNSFVAWSTNSSVRYTFTYDPHAADVRLFEFAGGTVRATNSESLPKPKWTWTN